MRVVIADTGPLNYLVLIEQIDILPALFGIVVVPEAVRRELTQSGAPPQVRTWMESAPFWLSVEPATHDGGLPYNASAPVSARPSPLP